MKFDDDILSKNEFLFIMIMWFIVGIIAGSFLTWLMMV